MSVKIRLARHGAKKKPFYRIVIADSESPRDGKFLENVGTYDPLKDPAEVILKPELIEYWIGQGAIATNTVKNILKKEQFFSNSTYIVSLSLVLNCQQRRWSYERADLLHCPGTG